ncbi:MAG: hypothetical protein R3D46_01080 [Defluviimonas denitrificans]
MLNPDAFADAGATGAIMAAAAVTPGYGLMGGQVCYADPKSASDRRRNHQPLDRGQQQR